MDAPNSKSALSAPSAPGASADPSAPAGASADPVLQQLVAGLQKDRAEYESLTRENERLTRENERLTREKERLRAGAPQSKGLSQSVLTPGFSGGSAAKLLAPPPPPGPNKGKGDHPDEALVAGQQRLLALNAEEAVSFLRLGCTDSASADEAALFRRSYEKKFNKNWLKTEPYEILADIIEASGEELDFDNNPQVAGNTLRGKLRVANWLFILEQRATDAVSDFVLQQCDNRYSRLSKYQKATTGECNGCIITWTPKDLRHLIHSTLEQYGEQKFLPTAAIQTLHQLIVEFSTGLPVCEQHSIAPADWEYYLFIDAKGEVVYREMVFSFCWSTRLGPGCYSQSVCEDNATGAPVELACVMWTLLLLQRLGVIEDALDAFHARGQYVPQRYETCGSLRKAVVDLGIDRDRHLSRDELAQLYRTAAQQQSTTMHNFIMTDANNPESPTFGSYELPQRFDETICQVIADQPKNPMYRQMYDGTHPMSRQQHPEQRHRLLAQLCKAAGYTNSRRMFIGGTGARKGFAVFTNRQNEVTGIDVALHNDSHMMNTAAAVRQEHYRRAVPANAAMVGTGSGMDRHIAERAAEEAAVPPAYTRPDFFDATHHSPTVTPLGNVADFLCKHAVPEQQQQRQDDPCVCPYPSCGVEIFGPADYLHHIHEVCPYRETEPAVCPACGISQHPNPQRNKSTSTLYLVHIGQGCQKPSPWMSVFKESRRRGLVNDARAQGRSSGNSSLVVRVQCDACSRRFASRASHAKHLRESRTCPSSRS